jgi:hypothetical protein
MWVPSDSFNGELIHLEPFGQIGGPIVFVDPRWLEDNWPSKPLQVLGICLDAFWDVSRFWWLLPVRLVVVRTIVIIVSFITIFLLFMLLISASAFNSATCISTMDDVR